MTDRVNSIDGLLEHLGSLDTQAIKWELKKHEAVRAWAMNQLGIDYEVGDRVVIWAPIQAEGGGWAPYREALAIGATGVVRSIDFSPHHGTWHADVTLDYAWQISGPGPNVTRYWKGRADETPPWATSPHKFDLEHYPDGKPKTFMLNVNWVEKHFGAPVLLCPVPPSSASVAPQPQETE